MGSDETQPNPSIPSLQFSSLPPLNSPDPEPCPTFASPLHTLASVPFRWEEEPGKPFPTSSITSATVKGLELPPRLLNEANPKPTKTPSPTTVLEGPYTSHLLPRSILESSSFRFLRKRQWSFDLGGSSPDRGLRGPLLLTSGKRSEKGVFGSWRKTGGISEIHGGDFVFPHFSDDGVGGSDGGTTVKVSRLRRKRSLLGLSHAKSHFWATIYGAFKQFIPRRSTKWRKEGL